jgi:hypothetical protein
MEYRVHENTKKITAGGIDVCVVGKEDKETSLNNKDK